VVREAFAIEVQGTLMSNSLHVPAMSFHEERGVHESVKSGVVGNPRNVVSVDRQNNVVTSPALDRHLTNHSALTHSPRNYASHFSLHRCLYVVCLLVRRHQNC